MLLSDAREYYIKYLGDGHKMYLDDIKRYEEFKAMNIPERTKAEWDDEIVAMYFKTLHDDPDDVWAKHDRIIGILKKKRCDYLKWGKLLLDELEGFEYLNKKNKILIIENMAGRDRYHKGGAYIIITKTPYAERLDQIMQEFTDFYVTEDDNLNQLGWRDIRDRYNRAVIEYNRAYRKWTERPGDEAYSSEE